MIDVLIPVLGRIDAARRMAFSLEQSEAAARLLFICSSGPDIAACCEMGEVLVVDWRPSRGDFARKINAGYRATDSEWVFQGATDIIFHLGWDVAALGMAAERNKRVIGTNDLHNVSVKRGFHSTHTLFARSYIEERYGTVDESDPVFWEGYDHQYVDVEFIEVARRRDEFISAPDSIVEHFHPYWGNAEKDATYAKAMRQTGQDRQLYLQRLGKRRRG